MGKDSPRPYMLTIRNKDGALMERQPEDSREEAIAAAVRITTVPGQKSWRVVITGPSSSGSYVATYRNGKEVRRGK